jgi:uncharacterized protein YrrD
VRPQLIKQLPILREVQMLHSLENLIGAPVEASDGEIGRISDFLFEDQSWTTRYVAVDVRHWLARRDVLIAVSALDCPNWTGKTFPCHLTKDQVRHSPDIDSKKPVSRQQEIAMREFYKWPAYWSDRNLGAFPIPVIAGRQFPVSTEEDPHLRSAEALTGYDVRGDGNEIGRLEDFIVDEDSWHIGYLDVKTGDWLHGRSMLIPTNWVKNISWAHRRVTVNHSRTGRHAA